MSRRWDRSGPCSKRLSGRMCARRFHSHKRPPNTTREAQVLRGPFVLLSKTLGALHSEVNCPCVADQSQGATKAQENTWEFVQDAFRRLADGKPESLSPLSLELLVQGRPALLDKASRLGKQRDERKLNIAARRKSDTEGTDGGCCSRDLEPSTLWARPPCR